MELGIREEELKKKTNGRGGEGIEGYTLDQPSVSVGCPYKEQPKTCTCASKLYSFLELLFFHGAPTYFKERGRPQTTHLSGFCFPIWNRISRRQRRRPPFRSLYFYRSICLRSNGFPPLALPKTSLSFTGSLRRAICYRRPSPTADMLPIRRNGFERRTRILALDSPEDVVQFPSPFFPFEKGLSCIV